MTTKTQTMLTIALTAAVSVLMVDRMIEPAHAQSCPSIEQIRSDNNRVIRHLTDCTIETSRNNARVPVGMKSNFNRQKCSYPR